MQLGHIQLGTVFQTPWDERPGRVIAFDDEVVMYDGWWPASEAWGLADFNGSCSYLRLTTAMVLRDATYLRTETYTSAEFQLHRPDLPLSLCIHTDVNWSADVPTDTAETSDLLSRLGEGSELGQRRVLPIPAVYLAPFGPQKGQKRAVLVKAVDGQSFTEAELIWNAWRIQAPFVGAQPLTQGMGLYRSGLNRKVPSYYLWGDKSLLERP